MTRKDFQWFAEWLGAYGSELDQDAIAELCSYFHQRNSRFDKWRFLDEVETQSYKQRDQWTP